MTDVADNLRPGDALLLRLVDNGAELSSEQLEWIRQEVIKAVPEGVKVHVTHIGEEPVVVRPEDLEAGEDRLQRALDIVVEEDARRARSD